MSIASATENDLVQILFGSSGSELVLCKNLKRHFISSEIHKPYYDMIIDRLDNDGAIRDAYKLSLRKNKEERLSLFNLLAKASPVA
ncbi:hypothetical protein AGMMS49941_04270 [Deferribacterales bacterium]|nr:hypothetical protein AGMMS49941_04270 [Deferribacterales bacterium]